jgi:MFS family permease
VWIGSIIGSDILGTTTWRWGYGIWTIILPAMFLPLALTLFINGRKAKRLGLTSPGPWRGLGPFQIIKDLFFELDIGGILLLSGAFALILVPLTIATRASGGWSNASIIAMIVIGFVCLVAFPLWESTKKLSPKPLIPLYLLKSRTFTAGCGVGFFYFSESFCLSCDTRD